MIDKSLKQLIIEKEQALVSFRRTLHMHPEIAFEELETTNRIAEQLDHAGIPYKRMNPTGLLATIKGEQDGKAILLRADIDALPVEELNTHLDYRSTEQSKMHACGHDAHTSMLLTATIALNERKEHIKGTVRILFQPAEEIAEGAQKMVEQGVMAGVDNVFGIHIWSELESGKVSCPPGPSFAAADLLTVQFKGRGGHAAMPHQTVDAAVMASQFVSTLQTIVSREIDPLHPAVVTIGKMEVGSRFNVIAENALLEGTIRTFDQATRDKIETALNQYATNIAQLYGGTAVVDYVRKTEPVVNEARSAQLVQDVAAEAFGADVLQEEPPTMGAEDFGYYMHDIPGAFALVGAGNTEKDTRWAHHHGRFNIDEDAMLIGAELYAQYALSYLNQTKF
ncbi:amidohydrolase [Marinilactibacillus kalidii]|uniref:amidohydrolase n=1 Tax=Marinilactibacillus kalidii TaxID=2820274 RepID=UPI001ABEC4BE|nr:amidohydrolase [Marinilactibacillus kalidii]